MTSMIGKLRISLGLETAAFEKGAKRAAAEVNAFGSNAEKAGFKIGSMGKAIAVGAAALAGGALAAQLKDMVFQGLEYASALGEQAAQLGVSTKAMQEYRYVASQTGVSNDEMDGALAKLNRTIGEAATGNKKAMEAFAALGIAVRDANGNVLDAGDAIPKIAEALQKIPSPAERATYLVDLFGKSGQTLAPLMADGAKGVDSLRDAARNLGVVLSDEQIQKADATADKLSELQQVLNVKISAAVADNTDSIMALADGLAYLIDKAGGAIKAWRQWHLEVEVRQNQQFADGWFVSDKDKAAARKRAGAAQAQLDKLNGVGTGVQLTFTPEELQRKQQWQGARTGSGIIGPGGGKASPSGSLLMKTNLAGGGIDLGSNIAVLAGASAGLAVDRLGALSEGVATIAAQLPPAVRDMGAFGTAMSQLAAGKSAASLSTDEFTAALVNLRGELFPEVTALEEYRAKLALIDRALAEHRITADAAAEARHRLALDGHEGESAAPSMLADPITQDMAAINAGLNKLVGIANDNADDVEITNVRIAKSFKDMANETLSAISGLGNSIKGGDILGILSGVIGLVTQLGSLGLFGSGFKTQVNSVPAYAGGTNFHPGGLAMVGERGPELVNLPRGAKVYPNGTGPGGGGATVYQFSGNLMTPEFWQRINAGDAMAAQAGATGGYRKVAYSRSRSLR